MKRVLAALVAMLVLLCASGATAEEETLLLSKTDGGTFFIYLPPRQHDMGDYWLVEFLFEPTTEKQVKQFLEATGSPPGFAIYYEAFDKRSPRTQLAKIVVHGADGMTRTHNIGISDSKWDKMEKDSPMYKYWLLVTSRK